MQILYFTGVKGAEQEVSVIWGGIVHVALLNVQSSELSCSGKFHLDFVFLSGVFNLFNAA